MTAWSARRARTALVFGICLALAGLLPALLVAWHALLRMAQVIPILKSVPPYPSSSMNPETWLPAQQATWGLSGVHIAVGLATLGVVLAALGVLIALRELGALRAAKRYREDALRRVRHYRDNSHHEPVSGAEAMADPRSARDAEWISPAQDRGALSAARRTRSAA